MTAFKQFMDEIEAEAREEGQEALDELEAFRRHYGKQARIPLLDENSIGKDGWSKEDPCLMDAFFKHQQTLPPSMRSAGALLYCPCRKCNPARL